MGELQPGACWVPEGLKAWGGQFEGQGKSVRRHSIWFRGLLRLWLFRAKLRVVSVLHFEKIPPAM